MASTFEALLLTQTNLLLNPPQLIATQATPQAALTTDTWTKITLDNIVSDPYGWWNVANNRWTPLIPGTYQATCTVSFPTNATGARAAGLYLTGVPVPGGSTIIAAAPGYPTTYSITKRAICNGTTDYLELMGFQSSGAPLATNSNAQARCAFDISMVHL